MKILENDQLALVAGSANLVITQMIPTDGISDACLGMLVQSFQNGDALTLSEEQFIAQILSSCSMNELDLLSDRIDAVAPCNVAFI